MIEFGFDRVKRVLCLGAHSDDIEIGCGGTVLKLLRDHQGVQVLWVVFSGRGSRSREARSSAGAFLAGAQRTRIVVKQFRDGFFPVHAEAIKEYFEAIKSTFEPDLVFTHSRDDRHQDHRVLSDLTWNTFRNHLILEYEIPKYDGDLGIPNFFVRLDEEVCRKKVGYLCRYFQTQANKHWFSEDTFRALMRLRGIECASPTAYAEAFFCRKCVGG
jgi:LmbE family N-acetylglucosaminyl deacetylase